MGWPREPEGASSEGRVEGGNGGHESEPGLAPFEGLSDEAEGADIPEPPEPQEPDLPPIDESRPEKSGEGGEEGSPEDSSEKPDTESPDKASGGSEGREGSEDDLPGSGDPAFDRFRQAFKEAAGRGLDSGVGDRPFDVPLGSTLKDPENPLFRLKSPEEKFARDRVG